tara:strand:- start:5294 stop:6082 length:789 start_codon:yes stop_codon:yes gene_type:complete
MADFNSSLPVRTETSGDVAVKLVDGTVVSQAASVSAGGALKVDGSAVTQPISAAALPLPAGAATEVTLAKLPIAQGATLGANTGVMDMGSVSTAAPTYTTGQISPLSLTTAGALRVDTSGSTSTVNIQVDGAAVSKTNAMPVYLTDSPGTEVNDYNTAAAVAAAGTSNHDYTVTAARTLRLAQIIGSASGRMKMEVQFETGAATGVFNTKFVQFNSTSFPNMVLPINELITVAAGVRVRIIRTNLDKSAADLYTTICGHEQT